MRRISFLFAIACAVACLFSACGDADESPAKKVSTPSDNTEATGDVDENADSGETCERSGFANGTETRAQAAQGGWMFEVSTSGLTEFMNVSSFVDWQGPSTPGTYELSGINYKDCGLCLLAGTGCSEGTCEKMFYAEKGTVEISSVGTENGATISGVLKNVVFEEVTIGDDYTSTKVENGTQWCFNDYSFSEVAIDPNAPKVVESFGSTADSCVSGGNGTGIGNNINNLQLTNCNGEMVNLHDGCGVSKAVWFVHTAGWCGACEQWLPLVNQLYQQEAESGLDVYYILGEDGSSSAPTAEYCTQYAQDKGLDPARVLIDNGANGPWGTFAQSVNMYDAAYIPWNAVLRGSNMEYVWADNVSDGTITDLKKALDSALGKDVDLSVLSP